MKTSIFAAFFLAMLALPAVAQDTQWPVAQDTQSLEIQIPVLESSFGASGDRSEFGDDVGPSRKVGGESFRIEFKNPVSISKLMVSSLSNSGRGYLKIHEATASVVNMDSLEQTILTSILGELKPGLMQSAVIDASVKEIELQVEAFSHNDSTLTLTLFSGAKLTDDDFVIRRDNTSIAGRYGNYFDESAYKRFSLQDVIVLTEKAVAVSEVELLANSWVCSSYAQDINEKSVQRDVDFKTRTYMKAQDGSLRSRTELSNDGTTWVPTESGWSTDVGPHKTPYASLTSLYLLKKTPAGNLITETIIFRDEVRQKLSQAHVDYFHSFKRFRSVFRPKTALVTSREFCRPAKL